MFYNCNEQQRNIMKKVSKVISTILKLSLLIFIISFICLAFGVEECEKIAGASFGMSIISLPLFIIIKFSDAIIGLFKK
jgi:hypothetical protein